MGNSKSEPCLKSFKIEAFTYYFNRAESFILRLSQTSTKKLRFSINKYFPIDSSIGYLDENSILIAGGTSKSGSIRTRCYIVNILTMELKKISSLPTPGKLGGLFRYKNFMYLAGGITMKKEKNRELAFQGCPVMRYNISENTWEIFSYKEESINAYPSLSNAYPLIEQNFSIENLLYPGCFLLESKIYYFAGIMLPSNNSNNIVFSINLNSETHELQVEPYTFDFPLLSPICGSSQKKAYIFGGYSPSSEPNSCSFIFTQKKSFREIQTPGLIFHENYPIKVTETYIIIIAFPKFAIKFINSHGWLHYTISLSVSAKSPAAYIKNSDSPRNKKRDSIINKATIVNPLSLISNTERPSKIRKSLSLKIIGRNKYKKDSLKNRINERLSSKKHSTLNRSSEMLRSDSKDVTIISKDNILSSVISRKNDSLIKLPRKKMVKIIIQICSKLLVKDLTPLELSQVSLKFGDEKEVSVKNLYQLLNDMLIYEFYPYKRVEKFISILDKILEKPKIHLQCVFDIFDLLKVELPFENIEKKKCIMLLTRLIKAMSLNIPRE
ncbi:hypothetical protein SteCoe_27928 [Stentor coeruleus]|uniref:Uncharacterized protein n=1 Tax=Stentor coeruleus TaxID=5963 RepID=A0A1R2B9F4_9CILI|nr:hypothetical protein SteCoe_27928 [Stentor coeruleus]